MKIKINARPDQTWGPFKFYGYTPVIDGIKRMPPPNIYERIQPPLLKSLDIPYTMSLKEAVGNIWKRFK